MEDGTAGMNPSSMISEWYTVLKSIKFPTFCTFCTSTLDPTITTTAVAVLSFHEPENVVTCREFYVTLDGDTCSSIANNFHITLDQIN